ncbi:MAG: SPOR domain-containing protein [Thermodesulfovibrionales bacterium]
MNGEARKEDASVRIVGREFIIAVVVVFSSLSFTLGYFVGKNNAEKKAEPVVQTGLKPADIEPQQIGPAAQPQPPRSERQAAGGGMPVQDMTAQKNVSLPSGESHIEGKTAEAPKEAVNDISKEDAKKEPRESSQTDGKPHVKSGANETVYTVQLGALKNAGEARQLKAKYAKKGYKIYITALRSKGKMKIYKVRTGEFREKKDAEILALRLKKNEGLSAFVTVKND